MCQSLSMPFQKNNKLGFQSMGKEPMDKRPVCFVVRQGIREKLKAIPEWQERLRQYVDQLISETLE